MRYRSFPLSRCSRSIVACASMVCALTRCMPCSSREIGSETIGVEPCTSGECSSPGASFNESQPVHFHDGVCEDWHDSCSQWASEASCLTHAGYMAYYCPVSCETCDIINENEEALLRGENSGTCQDNDYGCSEWAAHDECDGNQQFMHDSCKRACSVCEDDGVASMLETQMASFKYPSAGDSIVDYMNPKLFEDPETVNGIKNRLRAGDAVVIKNAFKMEYAEAMHRELTNAPDAFELFEYHDNDDTFSCHHHNIYEQERYVPLMNATIDLFNSAATKSFAKELSGRRCGGETQPAASHYKPGDHSLPHTDHYATRSVAYVWHLTKNWKTGYGGHLYWCQEHAGKAFLDASFNTLVLFSVTPLSHHMVTTVNDLAGEEKRLTINSWWYDPWMPSFHANVEEFVEGYPNFEDYFSEDDSRIMELTYDQKVEMDELAQSCEEGTQPESVSSERCEKLQSFVDRASKVFSPTDYEDVIIVEL